VNRLARGLRAFGAFWWDFIVGDDWLVAAAVVVGLVVTALLAQAGVPSWWVLPVALLLTLPVSLRRGIRESRRD
jgi:hypothetical protein